jgi:ubiquinone biosynthesis protein UbiJ
MKAFFLSALSKAINHYLELDPDSRVRLKRLQGKAITIELLPFHLIFQCLLTEHGIDVHMEELVPSETTIRGTPLQMVGVMINKENRHGFFADDLVMEGNAELGQQVTALFDELQVDWEEHFARLAGDVPVYHVSRFLKRATKWLKQAEESLSEDINEYIHEEAAWFPAREALQDFFQDIDAFSMDIDRAEARINQLRLELLQDEECS